MADANREGLAFVKETTFGTTPSGPPTLKNLRWTRESLKQATQTVESAEVNATRNTSAIFRVGLNAAGAFGFELSYGTYDELLEYALLSATWTAAVTLTGITIAATDASTLTDSGNGMAVFTVGAWFKLSGFTGAGATTNAGYFKIEAKAAGSLTVSPATLTADAAGESVTILQGAYITTGTTLSSIAIEKSFGDISEYVVENGMCINSMQLSIAPGKIIDGSFDFLGKKETGAAATAGSGTNTAAPTTVGMNAVDNVSAILEGQSSLGCTEFTLQLNNNLRARQEIGTLGAVSIGTGSIKITGSLKLYFSNRTHMNKYRNFTGSSIAVRLTDSATNVYIIDLPAVKYTDGDQTGTGKDTDVIVNLTYSCEADPIENIMMRWCRFPAA